MLPGVGFIYAYVGNDIGGIFRKWPQKKTQKMLRTDYSWRNDEGRKQITTLPNILRFPCETTPSANDTYGYLNITSGGEGGHKPIASWTIAVPGDF